MGSWQEGLWKQRHTGSPLPVSSGTHSDVRVSQRMHTAEQHADAELIQIAFDTPNNSEDTEAHTEGLDDPERLTDTLGRAARAVALSPSHTEHTRTHAQTGSRTPYLTLRSTHTTPSRERRRQSTLQAPPVHAPEVARIPRLLDRRRERESMKRTTLKAHSYGPCRRGWGERRGRGGAQLADRWRAPAPKETAKQVRRSPLRDQLTNCVHVKGWRE